MLGREHTPETRLKMSQWQIGKQVSQQTRDRISVKAKRTYVEKYGDKTPEILAKKRTSMLGKNRGPKSEETKAKISATKRARHQAKLANLAVEPQPSP